LSEEVKEKSLGKGTCPFCGKEIEVKRLRTVVSEPVKGEYDDQLVLEKSTQTKLGGEIE